MKILVVDDHPQNRNLLETLLTASGYEVVSAANGRDALHRARAEKIDLIIADILMPEMDGFQFCREVKKDPALATLPFIFYTATYTDPRDEALALSLGADRFLIKPAEPEIFLSILREVIAKTARTPRPPSHAAPDEPVFLQQYNQRLVQKLESKVAEVERAYAQLRREVDERRHAEAQVKRLNAELEARVQERTAQLAAANRELDAFTASVSHDLQAPLRHLAGFSELLKQHLPATDARAHELTDTIHRATRRMADLIDGLLRFARLGRCPISRQNVSLTDLVAIARHELEPAATDRKITWKIGALPTVIGDFTLLRQVMVNLLDNALKYTRQQPAPVIEIGSRHENGHHVIFIRDNGAGFDMRYSGKLFGVFQRLHTDSEFQGTGIGLANVQRILQRHGGSICAEAEPGRGATFTFRLPEQPPMPPGSDGSQREP